MYCSQNILKILVEKFLIGILTNFKQEVGDNWYKYN